MRALQGRALRACIGLTAVAAALAGASMPSRAAPPAEAPSRTYAMGFAPTPPIMTTDSVIATIGQIAPLSEYALVQREVPWPQLLGGSTINAELDNLQPFIDLLRSNGMKIVFVVDPLDGLDRTKEPPDLVALGHSLLEPQILQMHEDWVRAVAERFHPEYFGLASEINTLAAHGNNAPLYDTIVSMVGTLTPDIHALDPGATVFVSFQMEDAWQHAPFPAAGIDEFGLISDFHVDALGLSSYPSFGFAHPSDIPADYYARFAQATPLPLLQVEGGWSSVSTPWGAGSPADQAAYIDRIAQLLDGVQARLWVTLIYADLDLGDPSWNLPPDRQAELQNFASQGITDSSYSPKPAYAEWQTNFARPLAAPASVGGTATVPDAPASWPDDGHRGPLVLLAGALLLAGGALTAWRKIRRA